jgi:hypothetical protein
MTKTDLEFIHDEMDRFKKQTNPILTISPGEFLDDQESAVVERFALDVIRAIRGFRVSSSRVVLPKVVTVADVDECCDESIPSGR